MLAGMLADWRGACLPAVCFQLLLLPPTVEAGLTGGCAPLPQPAPVHAVHGSRPVAPADITVFCYHCPVADQATTRYSSNRC